MMQEIALTEQENKIVNCLATKNDKVYWEEMSYLFQ